VKLSRGGQDKTIGVRRGKGRTNNSPVGSHSSTTEKLTTCSAHRQHRKYELCSACKRARMARHAYAYSHVSKQSIRVYVYRSLDISTTPPGIVFKTCQSDHPIAPSMN
jgi:hypothetical protein